MKSTDFGAALRAFAGILDAAGSPDSRDHITSIASVFDAVPTSTVSTITNHLNFPLVSQNARSPNLGEVAQLLSALQSLLAKTANASVLKDFNLVEKLLRDHA